MAQLLNEEGLPIVDVTETEGAPIVSATGDSLISDEDALVRWNLLSSFERERRAKERDRILDLLEAEEAEEEAAREAKEEAERKRKEREREVRETSPFLQSCICGVGTQHSSV